MPFLIQCSMATAFLSVFFFCSIFFLFLPFPFLYFLFQLKNKMYSGTESEHSGEEDKRSGAKKPKRENWIRRIVQIPQREKVESWDYVRLKCFSLTKDRQEYIKNREKNPPFLFPKMLTYERCIWDACRTRTNSGPPQTCTLMIRRC